jgi:hypothetical protein
VQAIWFSLAGQFNQFTHRIRYIFFFVGKGLLKFQEVINSHHQSPAAASVGVALVILVNIGNAGIAEDGLSLLNNIIQLTQAVAQPVRGSLRRRG